MCTLVSRDAVQVVRIENGRVTGRHADPCFQALRRAGEGIRTLDVHLGKTWPTAFLAVTARDKYRETHKRA